MAVKFGQLAVGWCLNHPEAQAGYAQCISKVVCKPPDQAGQPDSDPAACLSYGECDCSRIEDKDCDEYFQCISNSKCAACTAPDTTSAPSTSTVYATETLTPGTYTITSDGTVMAAVVPSPTATVTDFTTITNSVIMTATSTLTITRYPTAHNTPTATATDITTITDSVTKTTKSKMTVTSTRVHTVISTILPTATAAPTSVQTSPYKTMTTSMFFTTRSTTPTETSPPTCPSYCDCGPKYGDPDAYESCLQQPECAGCGIPFPPVPEPVPESTTHDSTTAASANPTPSCAAWCDCSKIKDKDSHNYFQCITNPDCERCLIGGRRSGKRTIAK